MKLLAFGEVMMRLMCDDHKLLNQTDLFHGQYTGTGVNICAGLYQMGEEVYLATTLPDHHVGRAAAGQLRKLGIHDDYIRYAGNHIGIYFLEQGIGNRPSFVTYLNRLESSFGLANALDYDMDRMLQDMDALHICGIALAMSEQARECALSFARRAKALGVKVFFDCNYRASLWEGNKVDSKAVYQEMAELADVLFASYRDGEQLGIDSKGKSERMIIKEIQQRFHIECIFGTNRLEEGQYQGYMLSQHGYWESEVYTLTIFDRIGAGDAFAAGAIYGYFHIQDPKECITFASVSGVLGHTTYGDSPALDKQEIERFIKEGKKDILR